MSSNDRQHSRAARSQAAFLSVMSQLTRLSSAQAEEAVVAVICALEHRLFGSAPRKLESQLPSLLRDRVQGCLIHAGQPPAKLSQDEFLHFVGDHLGMTPRQAEVITRQVFQGLQIQLSPGETEHVIAQLPKDIAALWQPIGLRGS